MEQAKESQRALLIKRIANRLRPVCTSMPRAEFDDMVARLADIEIKYGDVSTPERRESD